MIGDDELRPRVNFWQSAWKIRRRVFRDNPTANSTAEMSLHYVPFGLFLEPVLTNWHHSWGPKALADLRAWRRRTDLSWEGN